MNLAEKINDTIRFLGIPADQKPRVAITLGSGLANFANQIKCIRIWNYEDIPHFFKPSVDGHSGQLILGMVGAVPVLILQGRYHFYEGLKIQDCVFPTQVSAQLGVEAIILTNAAGGMIASMTPGDFMVIEDHINLTGQNPLIGSNDESLGPRFPDMTQVYDKELAEQLSEILAAKKIPYSKGIYCGLSGPTYETPAEVRYLKGVGASAVGMSTVNEAIAARHMGIKVVGMSCITNMAAGMGETLLHHEEVQETARKVESYFCETLNIFIEKSF